MSDIIGVVVTESSGRCSNLTVGKFYEVTDEGRLGFHIKDDDDAEIYCLWDHCAFGCKYKPIYEEPRVLYWDYMLKGGQGDQEKPFVGCDIGSEDFDTKVTGHYTDGIFKIDSVEQEDSMTEFKVGDKVRVVSNSEGGCWERGHIGFIYVTGESLCKVSGNFHEEGFGNWYSYNDLELVQEDDQVNHLNHCGHGEYEQSCKYGEDETCPSINKSNIYSPSHYNEAGIECIDAIRATLGPNGFQAYCKGNCMKYLWRYEYKNGVEDLKKAQVYLNWMVESLEGTK